MGQNAWRFCQKCTGMFFDGRPDKGACPRGGGHESAGFNFVLPHDVDDSPTAQGAWRFCQKCTGMFFDGRPDKGACPRGGGHESAGFNFVLPHFEDEQEFDTGPLTSDLPLGGSAHLVIMRSGAFTYTSHAHDSGADNIDYTLTVVLMTPDGGTAFTFAHQGSTEGTSAGLPFGTPRRDDDSLTSGFDPTIRDRFDNIRGSRFIGTLTGTDTLVAGVEGVIEDILKQAAQELGKAAAQAVIALVSA